MDRRQRKTREAIFEAFTELLSKKRFSRITVGEIIEKADVGRATFYAHFETKDHLLKAFCEELFCHVIDKAENGGADHRHIFSCDEKGSVFYHLFLHIQKNDNNIRALFSCPDNELFLSYFKNDLKKLAEVNLHLFEGAKKEKLPRDFFINHISSSFVETVKWWVDGGMRESAEAVAEYFYLAV
ncbi:MAG: TetR/AcrR family transcriptional regulator [Ruminococcaceae bacterium]|nr:TetR/AcrR family transcriptional regulator [Oscillospiraceae bacterium]